MMYPHDSCCEESESFSNVHHIFPGQEIGRGSYSVCRKCIHKATGEEYAVKVK